jgi:hypothetical protein
MGASSKPRRKPAHERPPRRGILVVGVTHASPEIGPRSCPRRGADRAARRAAAPLVVDAAAGPFFDLPAAVAASRPGDRIEIHRAPTPYSATTISHGLDLDAAAGAQVAALTILNLAPIHAVRVEGLAVIGGSIGFATYSVGARFVFLTNADRLSPTQTNTLDVLHRMSLRTVRAWSFKEAAADIWRYVRRSAAESAWLDWARAAMRSRLDRSSVSPVWSASICRAS